MKKLILLLIIALVAVSLFAGDVSVSLSDTVNYPDSWASLSKEERQLKIFNVLTKISTQKGLQYISRLAGYKPKTLIEDAYCLSDVDDKKSKIEDPVFTSVPASLEMYALQKDNRFGENTFVLSYSTTDDSVSIEINNHTAMKFMGTTCVKPEALTMVLKVTQEADCMKIDSNAFAANQKAKINLLFYTVDIEGSFERRITALKNWFVDQVSKN